MRKIKIKESQDFLRPVKTILEDEDEIRKICDIDENTLNDAEMQAMILNIGGNRSKIRMVLRLAHPHEQVSDEELLKQNERALRIGQHGYHIHHVRQTDELYVNNFNEEWLLN